MPNDDDNTEEKDESQSIFNELIAAFNAPEAKRKEQLENDARQEEIRNEQDNRKRRGKHADKVFNLLNIEVYAVLLLFFLQSIKISVGNDNEYYIFNIDKDLWQTFLICVVAQISATYFIVISYLFPSKHSWISRLTELLKFKK